MEELHVLDGQELDGRGHFASLRKAPLVLAHDPGLNLRESPRALGWLSDRRDDEPLAVGLEIELRFRSDAEQIENRLVDDYPGAVADCLETLGHPMFITPLATRRKPHLFSGHNAQSAQRTWVSAARPCERNRSPRTRSGRGRRYSRCSRRPHGSATPLHARSCLLQPRVSQPSSTAAESTNRDQVLVPYCSDITRRELNERLSSTRCTHELDIEPIRLVHLNHRTEIAAPKSMLGHITFKHYGIERLEVHGASPGIAVTSLGISSPCRTIQIVSTAADRPDGPFRIAAISYLFPNRLSFPCTASPCAAIRSKARCNSGHFSSEYPSSAKNAALNRPTACVGESKYPRTFSGSTTARSANGSFTCPPSRSG